MSEKTRLGVVAGWKLVGALAAGLALVLVLLWLLWGFRWPPSIAVVSEASDPAPPAAAAVVAANEGGERLD